MKQNTKLTYRMLTVLVLIVGSIALLAAQSEEDYHKDSYAGFTYGSSEITGEDAPFVGISLGREITDRITIGAFASAQALSDFPGSDLNLSITSAPSAFNIVVGAEMDVRLFDHTWINPMVHLEAGHMTVAHMSEPTETQDTEPVILGHAFFASVGTGFELRLFGDLTIVGLHGYRYVPNETIGDMVAQTLSGQYSSVAVKMFID